MKGNHAARLLKTAMEEQRPAEGKRRQGEMSTEIPPRLVKGGVFRVSARNFTIAAYDGDGGFIGIREKFGALYLFTEYLRAGSTGTVTPLEEVAGLVPGIPLRESFREAGSTCLSCGGRCWWTGPPAPAPWECENGCTGFLPAAAPESVNTGLFRALASFTEGEGSEPAPGA